MQQVSVIYLDEEHFLSHENIVGGSNCLFFHCLPLFAQVQYLPFEVAFLIFSFFILALKLSER